MKFLRQEIITTTTCNENVTEHSSINQIFKSLKHNDFSFSISLKRFFMSTGEIKNIFYKEAKIENVYNNKVDLLIFKNQGIMRIKEIDFNKIDEIIVITHQSQMSKMLKQSNKISRFDLMDIEIEDD